MFRKKYWRVILGLRVTHKQMLEFKEYQKAKIVQWSSKNDMTIEATDEKGNTSLIRFTCSPKEHTRLVNSWRMSVPIIIGSTFKEQGIETNRLVFVLEDNDSHKYIQMTNVTVTDK